MCLRYDKIVAVAGEEFGKFKSYTTGSPGDQGIFSIVFHDIVYLNERLFQVKNYAGCVGRLTRRF